MFEKEADLAETEMLIHCHGDYSKKKNYREGWQEGATFGYNKANEWHYVKDGLPIITEKGRWLNLILKDRRVETFWWNFKTVPQRVIDNFRADVIAWKEIVLPKEIKEND